MNSEGYGKIGGTKIRWTTTLYRAPLAAGLNLIVVAIEVTGLS
jgi:hypothetical protein